MTVVSPPRVRITAAAADLLASLQDRHGPVMFHQSGGCCDGSSPMCYPDGEFLVGDRDVLLGVLCGAPVWISGSQFATWKHTQLIIDVVPGRGGGFSLEAPEGVRFLSRGRAFSAAELEALAGDPPLTGAEYEKGARRPEHADALVDDDAERSDEEESAGWAGVDDDAERSDEEESAGWAGVDDDAERSDEEESADRAGVDDAVAEACEIPGRHADVGPG